MPSYVAVRFHGNEAELEQLTADTLEAAAEAAASGNPSTSGVAIGESTLPALVPSKAWSFFVPGQGSLDLVGSADVTPMQRTDYAQRMGPRDYVLAVAPPAFVEAVTP